MSPFRFGVLGVGKIAKNRFIPAVRKLDDVTVSIIGSSRHGTLTGDDVYPGAEITDYEGVLEPSGVDAVYIALPNDMHGEWIEKAARRGIPVLCEKPLTPSFAESKRCVDVCNLAGVHLAEGFMYRHSARHQAVKKRVDAGVVGDLRFLDVTFSYFLEDLNNIRLSKARRGGALMDVGCYGIDLARFITGEEPDAVSSHFVLGKKSGVDEISTLLLQFPSGVCATVRASTHAYRCHEYQIHGTRGKISVPDAFVSRTEDLTRIVTTTADGQEVETFAAEDVFVNQIRLFSEMVRRRTGALLFPFEDGLGNASVLDAALRSVRTGVDGLSGGEA